MDRSSGETAAPAETDEALVGLVAAGDRAAFARLVGRHEGALQRFALRACGGPREAEDALQDGLLALWRRAATFRGDASARTWIFQLVVNACRRRHRRRSGEPLRTEPVEAAAALADGDPSPDERAGARQVGRALDAALAAIPAASREVLLLRDVEGLSGEEAARALGIGLAALKSRLHRARLELKARVEGILGRSVEEVGP
ncbi:MAG TPA: RNA polymerase sigma factor [Anaeromyxobacteraceae bacterium]|nr:RNA polymerase sigma factor [Anaeromyxobacteraceae bacterium]